MGNMKTKSVIASLVCSTILATAAGARADEVKIGLLAGFTGPVETIAPGMAEAARLAVTEANNSGKFLNGNTLSLVQADSTCIDASVATAAAERLVTVEKVVAMVGADCSGVTVAVANNVTVPKGIVMVSQSATSPAITDLKDDGYLFRTAPSDARAGVVLSEVLLERGLKSVAVTYSNSDYGKGMAEAFSKSYEGAGGKITLSDPHEDGKGDYAAEVGVLSSAGGDALVVFGYADQGGLGILRSATESDAFPVYVLGDGMYREQLAESVGADLDGSIGIVPWAEGEGADAFSAESAKAGLATSGSYRRESYDAAALLILAMQKAGKTDGASIRDAMKDVANAPGEKILPGQLGKALEILQAGGDVDYVGATNVEFLDSGDVTGTYREYIFKDGKPDTVKLH